MSLLGILVAGSLVQADPPPEAYVRPAVVDDRMWVFRGVADLSNGSLVKVSAHRIERKWNGLDKFTEVLSHLTRRTGTAQVESRRAGTAQVAKNTFEVKTKVAPPGLYQIVLREGDRQLFATRTLLGKGRALLTEQRQHAERLVETAEQAKLFVDEIYLLAAGKKRPDSSMYDKFQYKVWKQEQYFEKIAPTTDLSASLFLLMDIYDHIRNAQVWERGGKLPDEDQVDKSTGGFLDDTMTVARIQEMILSVRKVVKSECRVSAAGVLEDLLARARDNPKELPAFLEAAPEATRLVRTASGKDLEPRAEGKDEKDAFLELLERAQRVTAEEIETLRGEFEEFLKKHVVQKD